MTSTGIFCFVPISQRLVESGIIPASNSWRLRKLSSLLAPTFYAQSKEKFQLLLVDNRRGNAWSGAEVSVLLIVATTTVKRTGVSSNAIFSPTDPATL